MSAWWDAREPRERRVLLVGGVLAALLLVYGLGWLPLSRALDARRTQVAAAEAELTWMRRLAPELAGRAPPPVAPIDQDRRSLLARIDAGAREAGLGDALLRVEPVGEGEVRVLFEDVDFDALMAWLAQAASAGQLAVEEFSAQRSAASGRADVRLGLRERAR